MASPPIASANSSRLGRPRVLAVDDTPGNLIALEAVLGRDNEVIRSTSGPEALAILTKRQDIDVILLDVQLPVMDGYEVASRIKKLPGCEDIPIVFVTAVYSEDPYIKRGYEAGGVDYFAKPFNPELLKLKVAVYASFRRRATVLKERERQLLESAEVREAVEEIVRAGRKLSTLAARSPLGVIVADAEGQICQATEGVGELLETTNLSEADRDAQLRARAPRSGGGWHHESLSIRCADGSSKVVVEMNAVLRGVDGGAVGTAVVLHDLSESATFETEFEQRVAKLASLGVLRAVEA